MPVNDEILNRIIRHSVYLERFKNAVTRETAVAAQASLRRSVGQIIRNMGGTEAARLSAKAAIYQEIARVRAAVEGRLNERLAGLSDLEGEFSVRVLNQEIPAPVLERRPLSAPAPGQVWAAAQSRPFQGALMGEHLTTWERAAQERVWRTVQQGILDGQTTPAIVRNVLEGGLGGAPLDLTRRQLEAIVRTSISHVSSVARHETALLNDDIVKEEKWVSTLDGRTTPFCQTMDGATRRLGEAQWSNGQYGEPGMAHWNCRSSATMVTKSWRELGLNVDDLPPGARASMNGAVPADTTYFEWLSRQSKPTLEDVLGKTRAEMFLEGRRDVDGIERFYNDGRLLTLDQLRAKD